MATFEINGSSGKYTGTAGDDVFILQDNIFTPDFVGSIDGLGGNDRIVLRGAGANGPQYMRLTNATMVSIERIDFDSVSTQSLSAFMPQGFVPATVSGGAGSDAIFLSLSGSSIYTPVIDFQNWSNDGTVQKRDYVWLESVTPGAVIMAREGLPSLQGLADRPQSSASAFLGSSGDDVFAPQSSATAITGGAGDDFVQIYGSFSSPLPSPGFSNVRWDMGAGTDTLIVIDQPSLTGSITGLEVIWFISGGPYSGSPHLTTDTATLGAAPMLSVQGLGTVAVDMSGIRFDGSDIVFSDAAFFGWTINGTSKSDHITGTAGDDWVEAGARADIVNGADGDDAILGGTGNDQLRGGAGMDIIYGGDGNDSVMGGAGDDALEGDEGDDIVDGGSGDDGMGGGAGNDVIRGGSGYDWLNGGDGDDILVGGAGNDFLWGGAGTDTFRFDSVSDSIAGALTREELWDFNTEEGDLINLSRIDANGTAVAGDGAFILNSGSAFGGTRGELIQTDSAAGVILRADVNGDKIADFALLVLGVSSIDADHILL